MNRIDAESETLLPLELAKAFNWQSGGDCRIGFSEIPTALQANQTTAVAYGISPENTPGVDIMPSLTLPSKSGGGHPASVASGPTMAVRRLTPTECEALQSFPVGWTDVEFRGKPAADGNRYRALGNSMCVNVMGWLLDRIQQADIAQPPDQTPQPQTQGPQLEPCQANDGLVREAV